MKKLLQLLCVVSLATVSLTSCDIPGKNKEESAPEQANDQNITRKPATHHANLIYLHNQVTRFNSSQEAFDAIIQKGIVVVDFYADWCGPCVNLGAVIEQVASEFKDVIFLKIDVDQFKELSAEIRSIPVLVFYKNGREIKRVTGSKSKKELRELINSL